MCIIIEQGGSGRVIDDMCGYDAIQAVSHRQFAEARERSEASAFQHLHLFSLPFNPSNVHHCLHEQCDFTFAQLRSFTGRETSRTPGSRTLI